MFAGAFLYGITHGIAPEKAARAANFLAMKVITQIGARLHHGAKQFWDERRILTANSMPRTRTFIGVDIGDGDPHRARSHSKRRWRRPAPR